MFRVGNMSQKKIVIVTVVGDNSGYVSDVFEIHLQPAATSATDTSIDFVLKEELEKVFPSTRKINIKKNKIQTTNKTVIKSFKKTNYFVLCFSLSAYTFRFDRHSLASGTVL